MPSSGEELHGVKAAFLAKHQIECEGLYLLLWSPAVPV